jgi:23S rRNA (adenine-N6)-dimethyltransferase
VAGRRPPSGRPRAPRSQHFLRSRELAAELVRDAGIGPGDLVVEIGAGRGRLTEHLALAASRVLSIELDPALARAIRARWDNVEVIVGDAATVPLPDEAFRVVANLPFHRTTDLLHRLLDDPGVPLVRADLVVEWVVAVKRALPWPSSLNGVVWGAFYEASATRRLPRTAFDPIPRVDAGVLVLRRRVLPLVDPEAAHDFRRFVGAGFRKGLGHLAVRRAGSHARGRIARDLDAHEWAALFNATRQLNAAGTGRNRVVLGRQSPPTKGAE